MYNFAIYRDGVRFMWGEVTFEGLTSLLETYRGCYIEIH